MTLLGKNGHGQWKHDPQIVRKRVIIGLILGGVLVLAALTFVLDYFVVLSPPKPTFYEEDLQERDRFVCSSR